jgi:hypothetical protein
MAEEKKETMKLSIALVTSILVGSIAMVIVASEFFPSWMNVVIIPLVGYGISLAMSVIYQYSTCRKVSMVPIAIGDLGVLATTGILSLALFLEQIPFLKAIFGDYAPRNPITGLPYDPSSAEYAEGMANQNHYKIQILSGIVKAVIPVYASENVKSGFVYLYWIFWMTLLPFYFVLGLQGLC